MVQSTGNVFLRESTVLNFKWATYMSEKMLEKSSNGPLFFHRSCEWFTTDTIHSHLL